jgi:hypothetical protein
MPFHIVDVMWMSMFKEGRTNVDDDPHPGRLISASTEKDISTVKAIVDEGARYTVEEISDISGLNVSYVFSFLKEKFIKELCVGWITCIQLLTSGLKKHNYALLTRFKNRDA